MYGLKYRRAAEVLLLLLFSQLPVFASRSYTISSVDLIAQLFKDGSMRVTESRTYRFEGNFTYSYRTFPATGTIHYENFMISEDGYKYILSDSKEPGTFNVTRDNGRIEVRWFFKANDESKRFDITYTARNAVVCYDDCAVVYIQFISSEWEVPHWNVEVRMIPPIPIKKDVVKAWPHGPLWMELRIEDDGSVVAWSKKVDAGDYFEIRAIYPVSLFPEAVRKNMAVKDKIMKEESELAEKANLTRKEMIEKEKRRIKRWEVGKWIAVLATLTGFAVWVYIFVRFGKRPSGGSSVPKMSPSIPSDMRPALVDYLLNGREVYGGGLVSTMLDIARKGIISLREVKEERRGILGRKFTASSYFWDLDRGRYKKMMSDLKGYEKALIEFLFNDLAGGRDSINIKSIEKSRSKFVKFFKEWKKMVKDEGRERAWFDIQSIKGMYYSMGMSGALFILFIPGIIFFGPWGLALLFSSIILFILSISISHRTLEGELLARRWKALRTYLLKYRYRFDERAEILNHVDEYFVYGPVLGIRKKVYNELAGMIPPEKYSNYIPWFVCYGSPGAAFSPSSFAASFSAAVAVTTSAMSSASGTGGGATSGGGGASTGGGGAG